jgi:hypothetical protein
MGNAFATPSGTEPNARNSEDTVTTNARVSMGVAVHMIQTVSNVLKTRPGMPMESAYATRIGVGRIARRLMADATRAVLRAMDPARVTVSHVVLTR